jgi:tRNA(Ile)-lysidine synthase
VARAARRGPVSFGPRWLEARLAQLLPHFPDVSLCVAFSGGRDSTALLAALAKLRHLRHLRAVHIDHRLHPHSSRWAAHCRRMARTLGVALTVRTASIRRARGESLEAAARVVRYRLLSEALGEGEVLCTAHHEEDQLETVLLQLLRGAGVAGLSAMPALAPFARGLLARPLLGLPRRALEQWLSAQALAWVEDDSNALLQLDRNYLRARVLPQILARWPAAAATVARAARHAAEAQRLLDGLAQADLAHARNGAQLSAKVLRTLPPERRRNALRFWITSAGALAPSSSRLSEIAGPLLAARSDAQPFVAWESARVQRQAQLLSLQLHTPPQAPLGAMGPLTWRWRDNSRCVLPGDLGTVSFRRDARGPLDLAALGPSLTLRTRRGGERLRPRRGGPRRALKSLLQEAHVPLAQRARLPLLLDGERLLAVADLWLDESVQAQSASRQRARIIWSGTD